jgi:hypothetical protein
MYVEKETEKAFLVCKDAVSFWIQKRWLVTKEGNPTLTKEGWKRYHIAARNHWKHLSFDAMKEFTLVRETEKAVLLRCAVQMPDGSVSQADFWLPKAMTVNWVFVQKKIQEVEKTFAFEGTRVKWSGMNEGTGPRGRKGSAKAAVFSTVRS